MAAPPPPAVYVAASAEEEDDGYAVDLSLTLAHMPLSSSSSAPSPSAASGAGNGNGGGVRLFPCLFCNKKFLKSQALGGHQNAHKKERNIGWNANLYTTPINAASADAPMPNHQMSSPIQVSHSCHHQEYPQVGGVGNDGGSWWRDGGDGGEKEKHQTRKVDLNLKL